MTDLAREDFLLSEDDREQTIRYFGRQNDLPLTLGLLVDTTPSETNMLATERNASSLFFNKVLRPEKDKAFLIQFAEDVLLLQDLTSSRSKLERALDGLKGQDEPHLRRASYDDDDRQRPPSSGGTGKGADSTVLSDAIFLGADEILKPQSGRKAMIVLGDGDHIGDREQQAVTAAQRADALIYAIRIYDRDFGGGGKRDGRWQGLSVPGMGGPGAPGGSDGPGRQGGPGAGGVRSDGKRHLQEISAKTGGAYFEVTKKESLEQIYGRIETAESIQPGIDARVKFKRSVPPDQGIDHAKRTSGSGTRWLLSKIQQHLMAASAATCRSRGFKNSADHFWRSCSPQKHLQKVCRIFGKKICGCPTHYQSLTRMRDEALIRERS